MSSFALDGESPEQVSAYSPSVLYRYNTTQEEQSTDLSADVAQGQDALPLPIDFDPLSVEFDDLSYLNSLGVYGATPLPEGAKAAREASTLQTQQTQMSDLQDPLISFTTPNYSQHTLPDTTALDFDMPDIDWLAAIKDLGANNMPMGEEKAAPFVFGLGNDAFPMRQPENHAATGFATSHPYEASFDAFQTAPVAPMSVQHKSNTSMFGTSVAGFASHRDYQHAPHVLQTTIPLLPVEPLTPSPRVISTEPQESTNKAVAGSKVTDFSPGRPEKSAEHPWVRKTGAKSVGGATRTGKINQYRSQDFYQPPQRINRNFWQASSGVKFEYNQWGELDGTTMTLSVREMRSFLFENPAKLTLWIQTCPADSARRYNTLGSSRCRFKDCPAKVYRNTIGVGILRVAIDESHQSGESQRDPHHVAGYVHLYCAERFLDWGAVCAHLDVRADERVFATEPNRRWGASLSKFPGMPEVARRFIKYARHDAQNGTQLLESKFPNYPAHVAPFRAPKVHVNTLTYAMMKTKMDRMNSHRRKQLQSRGEKASHQTRNLGDLEQAVNDRRATAMAKKRKWLDEQTDEEDESATESAAAASQADATESAPPQAPIVQAGRPTKASANVTSQTTRPARPAKRKRSTDVAVADQAFQSTTPSRTLRSAKRAKRESANTHAAEQEELLEEAARQYSLNNTDTKVTTVSAQRAIRASTKIRKKSNLVSYTSDSDSEYRDDGDSD